MKKLVLASFLIAVLLFHLSGASSVTDWLRFSNGIDCPSACQGRCQKASRHKMCLRACGTCCARCSCVPPGTYGNRDVCPCYANMKTHGGRLKCP